MLWALIAMVGLLLGLLAQAPADAAYSPKLKRYPYLTDVVGSSATVNWATDTSATTATLRYGKVSGGSCTAASQTATRTSISVNSVSEYQWKARVDVEPDTEYCYRVYLGTSDDLLATDSSPRFWSQVPAGSATPFTFAVFGDWGDVDDAGQNPSQAALHQLIAQSGARFALTAGDNLHGGSSQTEYGDLVHDQSKVFAPEFWTVPGRSVPIFPAMGNHAFASTHFVNFPQDVAVASSGGRYTLDTRCCLNGTTSQQDPSSWYAFDAGGARIYVLETAWPRDNVGTADIYENDYDYHWTPTSDEYRWLEQDLAAHPSRLKFAVFHFPLYSDTSAQQSDTFLRGAGSLEGLLTRYGVDIAFNGHAHTYERNVKTSDGLVSYVTGGGGADPPVSIGSCSGFDAYAIGWSSSSGVGSSCRAPVPTARDQLFHFLLVTVNGTSVTVTPTDRAGHVFDPVTYNFPDGAADADLSVAKSDSPDPVTAGQTLTYTLAVHNDGPDSAPSVAVADMLPAGVTFQSASASQGSCSQAGGTVTCDLGTMASGASATAEIRVVPTAGGTLTNTAGVSGGVSDPDPTDDSDTETTTVNGGGTSSFTFSPTDDAYVRADDPAGNFGAASSLQVDASPAKDTLIKFAMSGIAGTVVSAKLRVYNVNSSTGSGGELYQVADTTWSESSVTWNSAPPASATRIASLGPVSAGSWYELDVTPLVTGDGVLSVRITSPSSDGADYSSKEGAEPPQLVVTTSTPSGYPRPKGATPLRASLVPAFQACASANTTHGAPLAHPSCAPPAPASPNITVGTPDANGAAASSLGSFALATRTGDVAIDVGVTDVRCGAIVATCAGPNVIGGADYTGEVQATFDLRITDRFNGADSATPATVSDTSFPATVPCAATADPTVGATCALATSANAVVPGSVRSGDRAIWEAGRMQVLDGGADGVAATSPNSLFATQGVFVP